MKSKVVKNEVKVKKRTKLTILRGLELVGIDFAIPEQMLKQPLALRLFCGHGLTFSLFTSWNTTETLMSASKT